MTVQVRFRIEPNIWELYLTRYPSGREGIVDFIYSQLGIVRQPLIRKCRLCLKEFEVRHPRQVYCGKECSKVVWLRQMNIINKKAYRRRKNAQQKK